MKYKHFMIAHKLITGNNLLIAKCSICDQYPNIEYAVNENIAYETVLGSHKLVPVPGCIIVTCMSITCKLQSIPHSMIRWNFKNQYHYITPITKIDTTTLFHM